MNVFEYNLQQQKEAVGLQKKKKKKEDKRKPAPESNDESHKSSKKTTPVQPMSPKPKKVKIKSNEEQKVAQPRDREIGQTQVIKTPKRPYAIEDAEKVNDKQKDKFLVQFKNKKVDFVKPYRELN